MLREIYRFCGSLKLAIVLLAVLNAACVYGTVVESKFNAEVARAYVYNAAWFNFWLLLLIVNLFCAAMVRYPWKPHLTGFVITHAGIILLLIGGIVDRIWGLEGFVSLRIGEAPTTYMAKNEQEVIVREDGQEARTTFVIDVQERRGAPLEAKAPAAELQVLVKGMDTVTYEFVGLEQDPNGLPGLEWALESPLIGRQPQVMLLNQEKVLGPATARFLPGMPPEVQKPEKPEKPEGEESTKDPVKPAMVPRRERHRQFARRDLKDMMGPDIQAGPATGAKSELVVSPDGKDVRLILHVFEERFELPVLAFIGKAQPLSGLEGWSCEVKGYYPNLRMQDNKPVSLDDKPENPAIIFELIGPLVEASEKPASSPHGQAAGGHGGGMGSAFGDPNANVISFYLGEDGKLRYHLKSRKSGETTGDIEIGTALPLGWMPGAQLVVDRLEPKAKPVRSWRPVETAMLPKIEHFSGLNVELKRGNDSPAVEEWIPFSGNPKNLNFLKVDVAGKPVELAFTRVTMDLPFRVELVQTDAPPQEGLEGAKAFTAFESTLRFDGQTEAKIHMNHPTSYPVTWYGPWLGTGFKFSQADHGMLKDPPDPYYSGVQVLRDPGWAPKWIGSLMIVFGIFTMFYLKPYFRRKPAAGAVASASAKAAAPAKDLAGRKSQQPQEVVKES
ncbi:MAG: cytochrome c biogenesis protein ResB [Planctomycetota bacterium]|nr:cytochrome c biogenesis protein ResB [Planctomycetota bacterium]